MNSVIARSYDTQVGRNDTLVAGDFCWQKIDGGFDDASNFSSFEQPPKQYPPQGEEDETI